MFHAVYQIAAANGLLPFLKQLVLHYKIHPVLVNFTAALVPVSLGSDIAGRVLRNEGLRDTGWWTLCFATAITPLTVASGWLFWMPDDAGAAGMFIHKCLGTLLIVLLAGLICWRWQIRRRNYYPSAAYLLTGVALVLAVVYQGHLGGTQSFGAMEMTVVLAGVTNVRWPHPRHLSTYSRHPSP